MTDSTPSGLADRLAVVQPLLRQSGQPYALIGGAAVMTFGLRARTRDLDFLVSGTETSLRRIAAVFASVGWRPELKSAWHLRLWDELFFCDVIAGETALEKEAVRTAKRRRLGQIDVPTLLAEHLCAMKLLAGRPRDLRDVAEIHENWVPLDIATINRLLEPYDVVWEPKPGEAIPVLRSL